MKRRIWIGRGFGRKWTVGACAAALVLCTFSFLQARGQDPQEDSQDSQAVSDPANVARISFVQGNVQLGMEGQTAFNTVVQNMPVMAGAAIKTGSDGQVEVAFSDGSVARLAPNSSFVVEQLADSGVVMEQQSGLGYYEFNVGDGHPPFQVAVQQVSAAPTSNAIFRVDLDSAPEIAVMSGAIEVAGGNLPTAQVAAGQNLALASDGNAPYTLSNSIPPNSWDEWNEDRDAAISQEAQQQTTARSDTTDSDGGGWNDLDYYGDWYPVQGTGNVWVPYGVNAGWDPFGYGYWGYYPGYGYMWISGYPWGWLPYHCGAWNYYSFGWGWAPGGCGSSWYPVSPVYGYSGYFIPAQPVYRPHAGGFLPAQRLVVVNRGAKAYGPWGPGRSHLIISHNQHPATLHIHGQAIQPLARRSFANQAFAGNRGTPPGARSALGITPPAAYPSSNGRFDTRRDGLAGASRVVRQAPHSTVRPAAPVVDRTQGNSTDGIHGRPSPVERRPGYASPRPAPPPRVVEPRPVQQPRMQQPRVNQPRMEQPQPRMNQPRMEQPRMSQPHYSPPPMSAPAPPRMSAPSLGGGGGRGRR